jgi:predicted TIM-barrel fold metal-dependent hydrolase
MNMNRQFLASLSAAAVSCSAAAASHARSRRPRLLAAQVGASQIMLGSDYPYPWELHPADHGFATQTLSDEEKQGILGGNAACVFGFET